MEAMKTYYVGGTVGDSYITLCKLYSIAIKEPILCKHFNKRHEKLMYKKLQPTIKEIYGLLPNIEIEFLDEQGLDIGISGNFESKCMEWERNRYDLKGPEYYPRFELGDINHFNLPESYVTLQIKSGTHNRNNQDLSVGVIKEILNEPELPIVIVGEKTIGLPSGNSNILDLRNNTTIKEVISIIKNSKHFYGLLGFLSFVACSHKIMSDLWTTKKSDTWAIKVRQEAVKEWNKFLTKRKAW